MILKQSFVQAFMSHILLRTKFLTLIFLFLISNKLFSQTINADFYATLTSGCSPLAVAFYNNSTPEAGLSYAWDFGNGTVSTVFEPSVTFLEAGEFDISLIISNGNQKDTLILENYIRVFENPQPDFTIANPQIGCVPYSVDFEDNTLLGNSEIIFWSWDFGDGQISNSQNPNHIFDYQNVFDISLHVIDYNGCKNTITKNQLIQTSKPLANFYASDTIECDGDLTTQFNNTSTGFPEIQYFWDFGDISFSTQVNPIHNYSDEGKFDVKLKITDTYNCTDSIIKNDYIYIDNISVEFTVSKDTACIDETIYFTNQTNLANSFLWDFGDGTFSQIENPNHKYSSSGNYIVKLFASYTEGCFDTSFYQINIEQVVANFSVSANFGCKIPFEVNFTDNSTNAVKWNWDFGNDSTSILQNPSTVYSYQGSFYNSLEIESLHGCKDYLFLDSNILVSKPIAYFTPNMFTGTNELKGCVPLLVNFKDNSLYVNDYDSIVSWYWTFGNGKFSNIRNPQTKYVELGNFNVNLIITTALGCTAQYHVTAVTGEKQNASFSSNITGTICASQNVQFFDNSEDSIKVNEWLWDFGDGTYSVKENPIHQFVDTGYFDVKLTVYNKGCPEDTIIENLVYVKGPVGQFNFKTECEEPLSSFFMPQIIDSEKFYWNFGDGSNIDSLNLNPVHNYYDRGNYEVSLLLKNNINNCSFNATKIINLIDLKAVIKTDTSFGCKGLNVIFKGDSSIDYTKFNSSGVNFLWDFDDNSQPTYSHDFIDKSFSEKGVYNVKLKVRDNNGCYDSTIKQIKIYNPEPEFFASNFVGCMPMNVNFNNISISDTLTNLWKWDFGDNQISFNENISHTYNNFGNFSVKLVVENVIGCKDSIIKTDYIQALKPIPNILANDKTVCVSDTLFFSNISDDSVISYLWNFGDSYTSDLEEPTHFYSDSGYYNISLQLIDEQGCDSTTIFENFIHVQSPSVPDFIADSTFSNCYPLVVNFFDLTADNNVTQRLWNFGDNNSSAQILNPRHTYSYPNEFDVSLKNTTSYGCVSETIKENFIKVDGPSAELIIPDTICKNQETFLIAENLQNIYSLVWILGDGNVAYNDTVKHKYNLTGNISPVLIAISDSMGVCNKYLIDSIHIRQVIADFQTSDNIYSGCEPLNLQFQNNSLNYNNLQWFFGDENIVSEINPQHEFENDGIYQVKLIINSNTGCSDTLKKLIEVFPLPDISISKDTIICRGDFVNLFAHGGENYYWLPDNYLDNSLISNPVSTPDSSITYIVNVTNENLCKNFSEVKIKVQQEPEIVINDTTIVIGESINLNLSSSDIATYSWFPDYDILCSDCPVNILKPMESTIFEITVTDTMGCFTKTFEYLVDVMLKYSVDVPTAFSPNNDGVNDIIYVDGWGVKELLEFNIYNRFGELVFSSNDINVGWDGTYKNKLQNIESYTYSVKVLTYDDQILMKTGGIKLLK